MFIIFCVFIFENIININYWVSLHPLNFSPKWVHLSPYCRPALSHVQLSIAGFTLPRLCPVDIRQCRSHESLADWQGHHTLLLGPALSHRLFILPGKSLPWPPLIYFFSVSRSRTLPWASPVLAATSLCPHTPVLTPDTEPSHGKPSPVFHQPFLLASMQVEAKRYTYLIVLFHIPGEVSGAW